MKDNIIARVEIPVNNSGTCCYYVECSTEAEIDEAWNKARDEGRSPRVVRLDRIKPVTPAAISVRKQITFDIDDEWIII